MLYLAEVQKRPTGFGLSGKTDLKLLACQKGEHNWTAVTNEEVIPADEAKDYTSGALVLVDLNTNKQVQRIQEASKQLVTILQNFSRAQEKFKTQWEEIEQWKASLTFQAQELNRREMELQAKEEQIQQLDSELERLEQQRQHTSEEQAELDRFREQIEQQRHDAERALARLQQEQAEFDAKKAELAGMAVLDSEKKSYVEGLLDQLTGVLPPTQSLGEKLGLALELVSQHQQTLDHHWQVLGEKRAIAQEQQGQLDGLAEEINQQWQNWHQLENTLSGTKAELRAKQLTWQNRQEYSQVLRSQMETHDHLQQGLTQLQKQLQGDIADKVDIEALERMPIPELQARVQSLQQDLKRDEGFVKDQEEELVLQLQELEALQQKIRVANEYERLSLNSELEDEQDRYRILNESLLGSQRTLKERQAIKKLHEGILWRKMGHDPMEGEEESVDLKPILSMIETKKQELNTKLQELEAQMQQLQLEISQGEGNINHQLEEHNSQFYDLLQREKALRDQRSSLGELWGRVNLYEEMLQPIQDNLNQLREQLEHSNQDAGQIQGMAEPIDYLRQFIESIANNS